MDQSDEMSAMQALQQRVLQRYGWSASFGQDDRQCWYVEVTVGIKDTRRFTSEETCSDVKTGRLAACKTALEGLEEEIQKQESKEQMQLGDVFPQRIRVLESNAKNWKYFWDHKPRTVGIDTEGNQKSPPVLVQIATNDYTILEVCKFRLSQDIQLLLTDQSIVKIFCDNYSHRDKRSLGLIVPNDLTTGHIIDLENVASMLLGPVTAPRGLSRIMVLAMPELNVLMVKPKNSRMNDISRFALIEQGKAAPLQGLSGLSEKEKQYAALDAWCTLQAYDRLKIELSSQAR